MPKTQFTLPNTDLPGLITSGAYRIWIFLSSRGKRLGCFRIFAALKGE